MDINLSNEDLEFRDEVRSFLKKIKLNKVKITSLGVKDGSKKLAKKVAGMYQSGQLNLVVQDGLQHNITFGSKRQLK